MECETEWVDPRIPHPEEFEIGRRKMQLAFQLNHTMPMTDEYLRILHELFEDRIGEGSMITAPLRGVCFERIKIGRNVYINSNLLAMARGGIVIEDDARIAANVQLITNNHDLYDRAILPCKPVLIRKGAWIGAGATILPGGMRRKVRRRRRGERRDKRRAGLRGRGRQPGEGHQGFGRGTICGLMRRSGNVGQFCESDAQVRVRF